MCSQWTDLDAALRSTGFTGFQLQQLGTQNLATVEGAVATAERQFVRPTENREWGIIQNRLSQLRQNAQYIALRPSDPHLDIVIGKNPGPTPAGMRWVEGEKNYLRFVEDVLKNMQGASQAFALSAQTLQLVEQGASTLGPLVGSSPEVATVAAAAKLLLPFLRSRGRFHCVVVVSASQLTPAHIQEWKTTNLNTMDAFEVGIQTYVKGWLWDTTTGYVHDSPATSYVYEPSYMPKNLAQASVLQNHLHFT